jgi:hypothetical protein
MISPQGMDELFWGRDHEDVNDWAEKLIMAVKVRDLNVDKFFKIAKLNSNQGMVQDATTSSN